MHETNHSNCSCVWSQSQIYIIVLPQQHLVFWMLMYLLENKSASYLFMVGTVRETYSCSKASTGFETWEHQASLFSLKMNYKLHKASPAYVDP